MTKVIQVIISDEPRRGDGKYIAVRAVTRIYDFEGEVLAERDPLSMPIEQVVDFIKSNFKEVDQIIVDRLHDRMMNV